MASMLGGMGDAVKEQAKKKVEDELAIKAPGALNPLFPCCSGPVSTMETCVCMVRADQQDSVKSAIEKCLHLRAQLARRWLPCECSSL
eukprot:Skav224542  [mRNA]  locus=scaffold2085:2595:2858:+ [translate_table: standard]